MSLFRFWKLLKTQKENHFLAIGIILFHLWISVNGNKDFWRQNCRHPTRNLTQLFFVIMLSYYFSNMTKRWKDDDFNASYTFVYIFLISLLFLCFIIADIITNYSNTKKSSYLIICGCCRFVFTSISCIMHSSHLMYCWLFLIRRDFHIFTREKDFGISDTRIFF